MQSLDPRVARLGIPEKWENLEPKSPLDQLETYEVFWKAKEEKPFEHAGIVHASDEEMAFVFAKEQYGRRARTVAMAVAKSINVMVSPLLDNKENLYDYLEEAETLEDTETDYEVFHLYKRGKQHVHMGEISGKGYTDALNNAKKAFDSEKPVLNIWLIKTEDLLASEEDEQDIWVTTPEKTFREATDYRAADKIKKFKEENRK